MWDRWISFAVMATVISSLVSVAVSSIFLGAAVLLWVASAVQKREVRLRCPPFTPILALFGCAVVISILFSTDAGYSAVYLIKLVKFLLVFFVFTYLSRRWIEWTLRAVLGVLALSALVGILQYFWLMDVNLLNRIRGFMSHWMTFSGQLMMGAVSLTGLLLIYFRQGRREAGSAAPGRLAMEPSPWLWVGVLLLMLFALLLSLTRNAWLGTLLGVACWLTIYDWRWLIPVGLLSVVALLLLPGSFKQRLVNGFDPNDATTRSRLELLQTGKRMIWDHPLTGVGPRMVPKLSARYRGSHEFPDWLYQHLHSAPLQIAAEMGLLTLVVWMALWGVLIRDFVRMARSAPTDFFSHYLAVNGICVLVGFLTAGLFEQNFGDSELLTLLLFLITAPYVVNSQSESIASARHPGHKGDSR
ncbi:MAG: O-antigen ligase family protein [Acidobacteriota bacterium]